MFSALNSEKSDNSGFPKRFQIALKKLKQNSNIVVTKSDKTNQVVILDKASYNGKLSELLNDVDTYEKLQSDPLSNKASNFNTKLKRILKNPELIKQFKTINPSLPYMYGLPKTHKEGCPLRPIISNINAPTYKLSKWLAKHLSPAVGRISAAHIKNTQDFVDRLDHLQLPDGRLVSLDVNSLFTKVPVDEAISLPRRVIPNLNLDLPIAANKFVDLVELCLSDNVFQVNNEFYRQKFGLSMGNSLSPILACLFMEYFETELLPRIAPPNFIWFRYIDDVFSVWPDNLDFDHFFSNLNNLHASIKFKYEWEEDNKLPFLDVLINKDYHDVKLSVYRKRTHSNAYIHYFSCHDITVKKSVISTLFLRAYRICHPSYLDEEIVKIKSIFSELYYPDWFITSAHFAARKTYYCNKPACPNDFSKCITLPFNDKLNKLKHTFQEAGIKLAFKYNNSISQMMISRKPKEQQDKGVYVIPCKDCENVYVGETGRNLDKRMYEHKRDIRVGNESSGVFCHVRDFNHSIDFQGSKLVFKSKNYVKRRIVESSLITSIPNFNLSEGQYSFNGVICKQINKIVKLPSPHQVVNHDPPGISPRRGVGQVT